MSVSGALLGISAAAAGGGGGGVASALAAASSALWHPRHHEHAAGHAAATLQAAHERRVDSHLEDSGTPSRTTIVGDDDAAAGGGGGSESSGSGRSVGGRASDPGDPRRVPGSGPGAVNVGGVRERDVIVDPGAPAGSLLYRLSYGMTGGYVRSMEDARADDARGERRAGHASAGVRYERRRTRRRPRLCARARARSGTFSRARGKQRRTLRCDTVCSRITLTRNEERTRRERGLPIDAVYRTVSSPALRTGGTRQCLARRRARRI